MQDVLNRLGFATISGQQRPLIAEDFVFQPAALPAVSQFQVVHQEVTLDETPVALIRLIHLEHRTRPHTSLQLRLVLCWNGFRDALTMLARFAQAFQRAVPPDAVVNAAERFGAGDFGVAWAWSGAGEPDIAAFVKNNVFVSVEGHDAAGTVTALARELSDALGRLRTGGEYADRPLEQFAEFRRRAGDLPRLAPGERLDIGVLPKNGSTFFFLTTDGSVNRSPDGQDAWYYRAGAQRGRQTITVFRIGNGILPVRDRLTVEVV